MLPILIILIGIILIILNIKAIKKEDKSFNKILKREELNNDKDYGLEIIAIRKDLAETVLDIQKELEEVKSSIKNIKNYNLIDDNKDDIINFKENDSGSIFKEDVISEINFSSKPKVQENDLKSEKLDKIKLLLEHGLTDDEICEELSIGKGEVLLIKSLLKK